VPFFKDDSPNVQEDFNYHHMTSELEYSDLRTDVMCL